MVVYFLPLVSVVIGALLVFPFVLISRLRRSPPLFRDQSWGSFVYV